MYIPILMIAALVAARPSAPTPFAQHRPLALKVRTRIPQVAQYARLELTLDLRASYDNPFDPEQVDVRADFTSPQGKVTRVNGFLDQPFGRSLNGREEQWIATGPLVWTVRFTPDAPGAWRYRVLATDQTRHTVTAAAAFRVAPSSRRGFIRRSRRSPRMFAFANERPFFAVGENMGWGNARGSYSYDDWLPALGRAGGNWIRVWMWPWNCSLEWSADPKAASGRHYGLGVYSLDNAWKLDYILDEAESNGVYTMLCFGTYGEFATGGYFNEGQWKSNPYNAANGGPCAKPGDFWTNPTARKLYRQRLRYIMARYACRTGIQAWEFWNETEAPAPWVAEMASYVKGTGTYAGRPADPYGHLLTTTYGNAAVWKIPEIDFTQTHNYGTGDIADHAVAVHNDALASATYGKPHLMGEFGIDWRDSDSKYDREGKGINLHNGLWSSAVSGNAGGAMIWWWDSYVHPKNLYAQFGALRRFADTIPWTSGPWRPLDADPAVSQMAPEGWSDLSIPATGGWGRSAGADFTLTPFGVKGSLPLPQFLYAPDKADLRTTPTFHVDFGRAGRFVIHVDTVSARSRIRFLLDGKAVRDLDLSAVPPSDPTVRPEYEKTEFHKEYNIYQARFNRDYGIDVPAGQHTITLENVGGDWASVESYTLTGYRSDRYPPVNLYGMTNGKTAILWVENALHNWKNVFQKRPIPPIANAATTLHGLLDGRYVAEWWDTGSGTVLRRESMESRNGGLVLHLSVVATDVAVRIQATQQTAREPDHLQADARIGDAGTTRRLAEHVQRVRRK